MEPWKSTLQMSAAGMVRGVVEAVTEVPLSGGNTGRDACGGDPCSGVHGGSSPVHSRPLVKGSFLLWMNLSGKSTARVNRWI